MARKISRRALATYGADQLLEGVALEPITQQIAAYLVESHRIKELDLLVRDIQTILAERGHVFGEVVSAYELSEATKKSIQEFTKQATGASDVRLEAVVDPAVLGGVKLRLPGKEYDATIARSLTTLRTRYKKA